MKLFLYFFVILALLSGCASGLGRVVSGDNKLNTKHSEFTDRGSATGTVSKLKSSGPTVAGNTIGHVPESLATDQFDQL